MVILLIILDFIGLFCIFGCKR